MIIYVLMYDMMRCYCTIEIDIRCSMSLTITLVWLNLMFICFDYFFIYNIITYDSDPNVTHNILYWYEHTLFVTFELPRQ